MNPDDPLTRLRAIHFAPRTFGLLRPVGGPLAYLGLRPAGRRVPVYVYFDHTCRRVRYPARFAVTTARDWRGGRQTYDKHTATDFLVPVGTQVVAAAPGRVRRVGTEPIGGPFVWLDHGGGFATTYHHLSTVVAREDQWLARGELLALSGAAGLAITSFFPWVPPHLHFGLLVDGVPADPFPGPDSPGFWADGAHPRPFGFDRDLEAELDCTEIDRAGLIARYQGDPLLAHNFLESFAVLAPARTSDGGDWRDLKRRRAVRLTLPFRAADASGLAGR